jgi:hypothetical protein
MTSVSERDGPWYVKYRNGSGKWLRQVTTADSKTAARRLAAELQRQASTRFGPAGKLRHVRDLERDADVYTVRAEMLVGKRSMSSTTLSPTFESKSMTR